jgi:muconolactone delta-isomerase
MEYLVTMTTHVPVGTSEEAIQDIRSREANRSVELAAQGLLLRLWRPPHQPGEWRTLGLFAANDGAHLEGVLQSMPLRIWRKDDVTPLSPHPNDPARHSERAKSISSRADGGEFLISFITAVPTGTPDDVVAAANADEADRARTLAEQGNLLRLWTLPGDGHTLGLWWATDPTEMNAILTSLPLSEWMKVETTPLSPHPNDPGFGTRERPNIR